MLTPRSYSFSLARWPDQTQSADPSSHKEHRMGVTSLPKRQVATGGGVLEHRSEPPAGSIPLQVERLVVGRCAILPVREGSVPNARKTRQSVP